MHRLPGLLSAQGFSRLGILALAILMAAPPARSADNGIYFGAALGDPSSDYDWSLNPVDIGSIADDDGFKLIAGFRPLDRLAIEVDYVDFGNSVATVLIACPAVVGFSCPVPQVTVDTSAVSVSGIGMISAGPLDLMGRVGLTRWDSDTSGYLGVSEESGTDATFGIGLQFRLQSYALRVELERFDFSRGETDVASIGFTYTFL
jgi:hypothetical protein